MKKKHPVIFIGQQDHAFKRQIACKRDHRRFTHLQPNSWFYDSPECCLEVLQHIKKAPPSIIFVQSNNRDMDNPLYKILCKGFSSTKHVVVDYSEKTLNECLLQEMSDYRSGHFLHGNTSNEDFVRLLPIFASVKGSDLCKLLAEAGPFKALASTRTQEDKELILYYAKIMGAHCLEFDFSNYEKKGIVNLTDITDLTAIILPNKWDWRGNGEGIFLKHRYGDGKLEELLITQTQVLRHANYAISFALRMFAHETQTPYIDVLCKVTGVRSEALQYWHKWDVSNGKFEHDCTCQTRKALHCHNNWPSSEGYSRDDAATTVFVETFHLFGFKVEEIAYHLNGKVEHKMFGGNIPFHEMIAKKTDAEIAEIMLSNLLDNEQYDEFDKRLDRVKEVIGDSEVVQRFEKARKSIQLLGTLAEKEEEDLPF